MYCSVPFQSSSHPPRPPCISIPTSWSSFLLLYYFSPSKYRLVLPIYTQAWGDPLGHEEPFNDRTPKEKCLSLFQQTSTVNSCWTRPGASGAPPPFTLLNGLILSRWPQLLEVHACNSHDNPSGQDFTGLPHFLLSRYTVFKFSSDFSENTFDSLV